MQLVKGFMMIISATASKSSGLILNAIILHKRVHSTLERIFSFHFKLIYTEEHSNLCVLINAFKVFRARLAQGETWKKI